MIATSRLCALRPLDGNGAPVSFTATHLTSEVPQPLDDLAARLMDEVPGVVAVVLGGSRARGTATTDSDTDVGVLYRDDRPLDVDALRRLAHDLDPSRPDVTELYGWGPWINGGAWLHVDGMGTVDVVYRSVDHVERTLHELRAGERHHDWWQQPAFGFTSVIYGGEVHTCRPLRDDHGVVARLKQLTDPYPEPLRERIMTADLWRAAFAIANARKPAFRDDGYTTMGCLTRAAAHHVQVLFALNRTWFVNDKGSLAQADAFERRPPELGASVEAILTGALGLVERVEAMAALHADVERYVEGEAPTMRNANVT
jgi:hypothetical protein